LCFQNPLKIVEDRKWNKTSKGYSTKIYKKKVNVFKEVWNYILRKENTNSPPLLLLQWILILSLVAFITIVHYRRERIKIIQLYVLASSECNEIYSKEIEL